MDIVDQLDPIFKPASIAVIGASDDPLKFGNWVTLTVLRSKYKGQIYLVNPKLTEFQGVKVYPSILKIPDKVDLVAIIVPASAIPKVMEECVEKEVKGAIIFSAGFREIGEEGAKREEEILRIAKKGNIRIVGPNCMGIYNAAQGLNITILSAEKRGEVGFITQSGGYGLDIFGAGLARGINFSKFISVGDKIDIKDNEYLEYLYADPDTKVIMMYMEGIEKGREFYEISRKITQKKPIFAIKIGRTKAGGLAAKSHTGAMAGEDDVFDASFKQSGIVRAYDVEELFDYVKAYLAQPLPKGNRVGMLVGSGGLGAAAVDKAYELGLQVPQITDESKRRLKEILPEFASFGNPIDFTASGAMGLFTNVDVLKLVFGDPNVDSWYFGFTGSGISGIDEIIGNFGPMLDQVDSSVVMARVTVPRVGSMDEDDKLIRPILQKMFGVTLYSTPERAIRALSGLVKYHEYLEESRMREEHVKLRPDAASCRRLIENALRERRTDLTEIESKQILSAYQIPTTEIYLARNQEEAVKHADKIGYPVVLKIVSLDITHKSDIGGVRLNLQNKNDVTLAYNQIIDNAKTHKASASIAGVSVQTMARAGIEVIIGTKEDAQFGPVIVFGMGGILTELLRDFSLRLIPISQRVAQKMIKEIKTHQLLEGYRQYKPVDRNALISVLTKVSSLVQQNPEIREMDLNPVLCYPDGVMAVDARIILKKP
jgi:acyl-CoA synthetase (NDP forming)